MSFEKYVSLPACTLAFGLLHVREIIATLIQVFIESRESWDLEPSVGG